MAVNYTDPISNGTSVNTKLNAIKEHLNEDLDMLVNRDLWMDS